MHVMDVVKQVIRLTSTWQFATSLQELVVCNRMLDRASMIVQWHLGHRQFQYFVSLTPGNLRLIS